MKPQSPVSVWFRLILGLFLIFYALNQFFHFIPFTYGEMPENTRDFIDAVVGYLPYLYIFEIIIGLLLVFNKWTPFILIVLFPLSISFLIFNLSDNDFSKTWTALIVAVLNVVLLLHYKEKYKPLFS
ncbi:DoxX protein [Aestuariivivens insulae]|uniref:DoxX protein n=1 Tax=Aestuariivivens insulae TaxID=1621988 RepID=UPI001F5675B7|nr:DoxX protein [Aestuariivivens insulae]